MSDRIKELSTWDFPDTEYIPDGYDLKELPKLSERNFRVLLERYNELVCIVNKLANKVDISE